MEKLSQFRQYYNQAIHPELLRLEQQRKQMLRLIGISSVVLTIMIILGLLIKIFYVTILLIIPVTVYMSYLFWKARNFVQTFKPFVVNLILNFIDEQFEYDFNNKVAYQTFQDSRIFASKAHFYEGEDYIKGKIGNVDFELSELNVREESKVRSRLQYVFKGVFLHASFAEERFRGKIFILPEEFHQYLSRSIKSFTREQARPWESDHPEFEEAFITYVTPDAQTWKLLSKDMQDAILDYRIRADKEIYISFIDSNFYIAITEPKDMLEPSIFKSNVSFDLVKEFYEDLQLLFSIVEDIDHRT